MSYLLNYKNWRAIHEAAIFESTSGAIDNSVRPTDRGAKLEAGFSIEEKGSNKELITNTPDVTPFSDALEKFYSDFEGSLSKLFVGSNVKVYNDTKGKEAAGADNLIDCIILGEWRKAAAKGAKNLPEDGKALVDWLGENYSKFNIKIGTSKPIELMGKTGSDGKFFYPQTRGRLAAANNAGSSGYSGMETYLEAENAEVLRTSASTTGVLNYINSFNSYNTQQGYSDQYKIEAMLDSQKALVFSKTAPYENTLYFYSDKAVSETGPSKSTETQIVGGVEAQKGATEIAFKQGSADLDASGVKVDASHPKVAEIGEKIKSYLGEKGVIDKMTLTSSASPEWNGGETMANYAGKTTNGTGAPAPGTDIAAKNADLAYRRGVTFQNALTQYLGGHVKANAITVAWKISTDEPGKGRHIAYEVATKSEAPQAIQVTSFAAGKTTATATPGTVMEHTLTWTTPAEWLTKGETKAKKSAEELAKQFAETKADYKINVSSKADPNKIVEVQVAKVEGGKVFVKNTKGEVVELENAKDRFKGWTDETEKMVAKEAKSASKTTSDSDI